MNLIGGIFAGIDKLLQTLSSNKAAGRWFVFIVILAIAGLFVVPKVFPNIKKVQVSNPNQCDYLEKQNQMLISALLEIRNQADSISKKAVSYNLINPSLNFSMVLPAIDTLPRRKIVRRKPPIKNAVIIQQQDSTFKKMVFKIDSVLLRVRQIRN